MKYNFVLNRIVLGFFFTQNFTFNKMADHQMLSGVLSQVPDVAVGL